MFRSNKKHMVIGLFSGFLNGLFGAGGGSLFVPAAEKFMNLEEKKAHATAVAFILPLTILSAVIYIPKTQIPWKMLVFLMAGGLLGGWTGAVILDRLPKKVIHIIFGAFMLLAAFFIFKRGICPQESTAYQQLAEDLHGILILWVIFTGFFSGTVSGMGIGGGTLLIPALLIFFRLEQKTCQAINLIYFIPTAVLALVKHEKNRNIEKEFLKPLIFWGIIGAAAGAAIALNAQNGALKIMFGVFLGFMGTREILKGKCREVHSEK